MPYKHHKTPYTRKVNSDYQQLDKVDQEYAKCELCKVIECMVNAGQKRTPIISKTTGLEHKSKFGHKYELPFGWHKVGLEIFCAKCYHVVDEIGAYRQDCEDLQKRHIEFMKANARRYCDE